MISKNYVSMKPRLLKDFDKSILRVKSSLFSRYGEEQSNNFLKCSREEYESLIPQIPYVGDKNPLLMFMLPTIRGLAIYRTILKFGGNVEDAGKLIYTISEKELQSIPGFVRKFMGYLWFSRWFIKRLIKRDKITQEREYPGNFVLTYIEGDGETYNFGVDYTECANVKFLKDQNALELAPFICATDKVVSELLGWGLTRTTTLAEGNQKCDFRFKKHGKTIVPVPDFILKNDVVG